VGNDDGDIREGWGLVDVDDVIVCNVHAHPLNIGISQRLTDESPAQALVDKRGKAVLPAFSRPS